MNEHGFEWQGKKIDTYGDVADAMSAIYAMENVEERQHAADAFMEAYRADSEHADANVGYITGYFGMETTVGMLRLFQTRHPILGSAESFSKITPDEAFMAGARWAQGK